jgi:RIO kinase 1
VKVPDRLLPLLEQGVIDDVIRPLQSGKEAQVYLVDVQGWPCVAKVYKEAQNRSFKHRADYTAGRKARGSREQRAMAKKSKFGREKAEEAWRSAEVDAIYRLDHAGVRVPRPHDFVDGVLVMELITDERGEPAPRLADVTLHEHDARAMFDIVLGDVIRMLCAGLVHGDLSDFNILLGTDGPVIIDFPQATDAAANLNARKLLVRDVHNLTTFFGRYAPELLDLPLGEEMWELYERGELTPESRLTGHWEGSDREADVSGLLREIEDVEREARKRREALGLETRPARAPVVDDRPPPRPAHERGHRSMPASGQAEGGGRRGRHRRGGQDGNRGPQPEAPRHPDRRASAPREPSPPDDLDALLVFGDV